MGGSLFSIGVSGLKAAQVNLGVTSHNVTNASTPGYSTQTAYQAAAQPFGQGYGFTGQGVDVTDVGRAYNSFLGTQLQTAQAADSHNSSMLSMLSQVDNLMGDSSQSLNSSMQTYFGSVQTLSQNPASIPSRQAVISSAEGLVTQFKGMNTQLQQLQASANGQISDSINSINALATNIADLNGRIMALSGAGSGHEPNDLLDQRDQAVLQLNKLVKATSVTQADGSYSVFIGNGQTLVLGTTTSKMSTLPNPSDPANVNVVLDNPNGTTTQLADSLLKGGQLGGLLDFRDNTLISAQNRLGNLAIDLTTSLNYQNKLGLDLNGNPGGNLFSDLTSFATKPTDAIANMSVTAGDPTLIAAASNMTAGAISPSSSGAVVTSVEATLPASYGWTSTTTPPDSTTHPSIGISGIAVSATSASNITATISGGSAPGTYNVVVDPTTQNGYKIVDASGKDLGINFSTSSQMTGGMSFTIKPNTASTFGSGDNSNLMQLARLQTKTVVDNNRNGSSSGLQTFANAYSTTVSAVGSATSSTKLQQAASQTALEQATTAQSNFSGVNLDQEAALLIQQQQQYQACSKVIQTAQTVFGQLLAIFN
ncbi:flagellar hook-associated protein FlgK [Paludibacterium yongneupense]|uniref:flagellar hook-associated protein FlgK n=1 Tax=Paludibacterium yongneupense TaxID=400061 RepID=UPI0004135811|nr:flagellar hook-associated protein FlgK [Paludibacterium yongneupense]